MPTIYIVEDDENIRELVVYALNSNNFNAVGFISFDEIVNALSKEELPDIILLDIMLPDVDGLTILKRLKENVKWQNIPVIMLTAKSSEFDKVKGLNLGADDYVAKPFGVIELIARVNAVLRRSSKSLDKKGISYKNITLNDETHTVIVDEENIILTFKEYELLHYLLLNIDKVLTRDRLLDTIWGYEFEGESRTVDMHIKTLRQKLKGAKDLIITVRGVGYKLGS